MAKRMREKLEILEKLGTMKIKIVERAGEKLVDMLHKSNAWSEMDLQSTRFKTNSNNSSIPNHNEGKSYKSIWRR